MDARLLQHMKSVLHRSIANREMVSVENLQALLWEWSVESGAVMQILGVWIKRSQI